MSRFQHKPESQEKLFTQVMQAAVPEILKLWEEGDQVISKGGLSCPEELQFNKRVSRSFYQCQPHLWQCYWQGGVKSDPAIKVDLFGQTYHVYAVPSFPAIPEYSANSRYYEFKKRTGPGFDLNYGYTVELRIREVPGHSQPMMLSDSCRDVYLPERIYGYSQVKDRRDEGFIWDNFDRKIFIDKFYVSNQQINEWRIQTGKANLITTDRNIWAYPAVLNLHEQKAYCHFFGKKLLEAKIFDAATMPPSNLKNPLPDLVNRPETPWQRDISKTFLGIARINPDHQLTPLDCQLAQVLGCEEKYYTTDSSSWMGINYPLGFMPESFHNSIEPDKNLKLSSRFLASASEWHELGLRSKWNGIQGEEKTPNVAFRCYEEVSQ